MEPFSVAAAAITLCPLIIQTARQLRNAAKSIKYARRELEDLTQEMGIFSTFYNQFMKVTSERMQKTKSASSARKRLISWAQRAKLDFEKLSQRVDALARDPVYEHSVAETVSAHCRWYLNKSNLKYLRYTLVVARQSMAGFTHICQIEKLDEELAFLRSIITAEQRHKIEQAHGIPIEQYTERVERERKEVCEQADFTKDIAQDAIKYISSKQSRNQNDEYSRHSEQVLSFSKMVHRDIKRTLHSSRSSERNSRFVSKIDDRDEVYIVHTPSQSSGTTHTQSTQSSRRRPAAPDSPPTSPEPPGDATPNTTGSGSILNYCLRCGGKCTRTEAHGTTILDVAPLRPARLSTIRPGTPYLHKGSQRNESRVRRSNPNHVPPLSDPIRGNNTPHSRPPADTNTHQSANLPAAVPQISRPEINDDEDGSSSGEGSESEMEDEQVMNEQASYIGNSKWRATGPFQGQEPRQLRERRQRDPSPEDHWRSKPWEKK